MSHPLLEAFKADLEDIKLWLSKQHHLPQNIDDLLLCRFLHTCDRSLEQSKHLIDLFFTIRSQAPEIFDNRDPSDEATKQMLQVIDLVPLPQLTKDKCKLFMFRLRDCDPEKYNFLQSVRTFFMIADTRLITEMEMHEGEIPIFDMEGFSLRHLTKIVLPIVKKYMVYIQEAHPIKLRQIHILNVPSFLDRCMALVKPFLKSEVAAMMHFHEPKSTTLYDYVPQDLLPEEYGGTVGKILDLKQIWITRMMENRKYIMDNSHWQVNEQKRSANHPNAKQLFGMQGSFRSLNLD